MFYPVLSYKLKQKFTLASIQAIEWTATHFNIKKSAIEQFNSRYTKQCC